jgi:hypothetical protein
MDFLGSTVLAGSAVTTGALTIEPRDLLCLLVRVTGYSGSDIASLRFNGDSGTNYWSKGASAAAATTAFTVAAAQVSQTLARLFAAGTTLGRSGIVSITNFATTEKIGAVSGATGSGAAATGGTLETNSFGWVNTTAQITSIELRTAGGSITMPAGTGFQVYGRNF